MEDNEGVMALQEYIKSVDHSSLPRIIHVCSGVYFQGKKAVDDSTELDVLQIFITSFSPNIQLLSYIL